jgi:hypothetical protein
MRTLPTGRVCYKVATAHERRLRRLLEYLTRRVFERGPMAAWLEAVHYAVELELWARIGALTPPMLASTRGSGLEPGSTSRAI